MCKSKFEVNENIEDESDQNLYNQLSCYIDKDFLIRMTKEIMSSDEFKRIDESNLYIDRIINPKYSLEKLGYLLPVTITMVHLFQTMKLTNPEDVQKLYRDQHYINKLKKRVLSQLSIKMLRGNDEIVSLFSHTPILYFTIGVLDTLQDNCDPSKYCPTPRAKSKPNFEFKYNTYREIFNISRSICTLLNSGNYANAYALLRKLIEMVITYLYLKNRKSAANEFKKIGEVKYDLMSDPKKKMKYTSDPRNKDKKSNPYFNYGWMKKLKNYNSSIGLNFKDLVTKIPLSSKKDEAFKNKWSDLYDYCCLFVHTNYNSAKYDVNAKHFLIITSTMNELLQPIIRDFKRLFRVKALDFNGTNIFKCYDNVVKETIEMRKNLVGK